MDSLITFDEAAEFLKNPPSLSPRPDFSKVCALRKHMVKALKQLMWPKSAIHRWLGMVLSPMVYALLEPTPFAVPGNPGPVAVYTQFTTPRWSSKPMQCSYAYKKNTNCMKTSSVHASVCSIQTLQTNSIYPTSHLSLDGMQACQSTTSLTTWMEHTKNRTWWLFSRMTLSSKVHSTQRTPPSHYSTG